MNSEQPVEPTQSTPTHSAVPESSVIANGLLARARWMQRALAPWTQRWLAQIAASTGERRSGAAGRRDSSLALTVDAATQTLNRIHLHYESHSTRPAPGDSHTLPLAGAPSLASTVSAAAEDSEAREDAPQLPAESATPTARSTQGPYSRPFNSVEDFLKAVEAAKARNYAPPEDEVIQPPAPHEVGPYSHAFNSFEEFVKALEASRQKAVATAPREAAPKPTLPLPGKIRPMSRVEELPARGSSTLADLPASMSTPMPAPTQSLAPQVEPHIASQIAPRPVESSSNLDQLPLAPSTVEELPSNLAAPAPAQLTVIPPFSPVKARSGLQPASRKSVPASEVPAPVEPIPAVNSASPVIPLSATATEVTESFPETGLPLVSPSTAEFVPSIAPEAPPADVLSTTRPTMETSPTPSARSEPMVPIALSSSTAETRAVVTPAGAPIAPSVATSSPSIQRAVEETALDTSAQNDVESAPVSQLQRRVTEPAPLALPIDQTLPQPIEPSARQGLTATTAPAAQGQVSESPVAPSSAQPEPSAAPAVLPMVQRQVNESPLSAVVPETTAEAVVAQPATSMDVTPARRDLPLVQRQPVEQKPTATALQQVPSDDKAVTPVQAVASQPVVQRQVNEPLLSTAVPEADAEYTTDQPVMSADSTPVRSDLPLVQRQIAEKQPTAAASQVTSDDEVAVPSQVRAIPDQSVVQRQASDLPLVQRQPTEKQSTAPAPQVTSSDKVSVPSQPQAGAGQPVVQRQASEPSPSTLAPEITGEEIASQPAMSTDATPARNDLPLVQRQTAKPTAATPQPATPADKAAALSQVQSIPGQPVAQRQASEPSPSTVAPEITGEEIASQPAMSTDATPARNDLPLVQRQTAKPTAATPQPATPADKAAASSQVQSIPGQPVAQRQASEPSPSTLAPEITGEEIASLPARSTDVTPARSDLPLVQRQTAPSAPSMTQRQVSATPTSAGEPQVVGDNEALAAPIAPEVTPTRSGRGTPPAQAVERYMTEAESASPEVPETSTPMREGPPIRSEMPLVQRRAVDAQPIEPEQIQRHIDALVLDQAANMGERILARVASHETVPAARLPALPLHQPVVQRVSAPEVKAAPQPLASQTVSIAPAMSAPAPLSGPVIQRTPASVIQRMPAEPATSSSGSGLIQRVENASADVPETSAPMDLDTLARQVYPIIKHLLAVERDRRTSR